MSVESTATAFVPRDEALRRARRGRLVRRITIAVLAAFVAAGALGVFGTRQASKTMTGRNLIVDLNYPTATRGGLPTRWTLEIRSVDGSPLPDRIEVRTTADYFRLFDHNDLTPEPDAVWQDDALSWTFRPDGDDRLRVELDARTQPDARWRYKATTDVLVDAATVATFDYTTTVVP